MRRCMIWSCQLECKRYRTTVMMRAKQSSNTHTSSLVTRRYSCSSRPLVLRGDSRPILVITAKSPLTTSK